MDMHIKSPNINTIQASLIPTTDNEVVDLSTLHSVEDQVKSRGYEEFQKGSVQLEVGYLQSTKAMSWMEKLITLISRMRRGLDYKLDSAGSELFVWTLTRMFLAHEIDIHSLVWHRLIDCCRVRNRLSPRLSTD